MAVFNPLIKCELGGSAGRTNLPIVPPWGICFVPIKWQMEPPKVCSLFLLIVVDPDYVLLLPVLELSYGQTIHFRCCHNTHF